MSLVDKFDDNPDRANTPGFVPEIARRQLRLSLLLVVAIATAASILDFALPLGATHVTRDDPLAGNSRNFSVRLTSTRTSIWARHLNFDRTARTQT